MNDFRYDLRIQNLVDALKSGLIDFATFLELWKTVVKSEGF